MNMRTKNNQIKNLWYLGLFAIAMAYLEAAVVVYLRRIYNISDMTVSLQQFDPKISAVEVGREFATLVMLWTVGKSAGKKPYSRFGFFIFMFGIWDIFYYIWLYVLLGWPAGIFDTDLLFLIPLPWWGPVLAPVLIAALMAEVGIRLVKLEREKKNIGLRSSQWVVLGSGLLIVLYTFMADALASLPADTQTLAQLTPSAFKWPIYLAGFCLLILATRKLEMDGKETCK